MFDAEKSAATEMSIRSATADDLAKVEQIIAAARAYLRAQGSPQWQDGYGPSPGSLARNLAAGEGYVLLWDGAVCGYATLVQGEDVAYTGITDGQWEQGHAQYIAIHSVALDPSIRGRGLAVPFLRALTAAAQALGFCDVRIDTHPQNVMMRRAIARAGFVYRGMVQFPIPNGERMAYQLPAGNP